MAYLTITSNNKKDGVSPELVKLINILSENLEYIPIEEFRALAEKYNFKNV